MTLIKKKSLLEYIIYSAIILVGIIVDQLTKFIVFKNMTIGQSIPLIQDFLHITYTTNDGAAFGMMDNARWVFIVVSAIAILVFGAYLYLGHADNMLYAVSLAMVISGGIGNMIDRVGLGFYVNANGMGEVIDFIDFCGIWNAIFNGADSFVCVGAGMLILALLLDIIKEAKAEREAKAADASKESEDAHDSN